MFIPLGLSADGTISVREFHVNEAIFHGYLEGDLLNVAMAAYFPAIEAPAAVVSAYFVSVAAMEALTKQVSGLPV
jgi:hypothetical protein